MIAVDKRTFFKNYKELCSVLGITYKTNTESKKRQIEELKQYYIITRSSNGYFVQSRKEIKTVKQKNNCRTGKYNKNLNKLLMNHILENHGAQPKYIILLELFRRLKYVARTISGIYDETEYIEKKYGKWISAQAHSNINAKIFDLLDNGLKSLSRSNHITVNYYYELKDDVLVENSDEIIIDTTKEMLSERKIKNEFFLKRKSEEYQKEFYTERNTFLKNLYGFEVKCRVTDITIINQDEYKNLNPLQYKKCCIDIFNQIKIDLVGKLIKEKENILNSRDDLVNLVIEMFGEGNIEPNKKRLDELESLEKLYDDYLIYDTGETTKTL